MRDEIKEIMQEVFSVNLNEIPDNVNRNEYSYWDSLQNLVLASHIEVKYNISLEPEDILNMDSMDKIVTIIEKKLIEK